MLHWMNPAHTARAADFSRVTDWQTDTANIGNNNLHLMHSIQPKNNMPLEWAMQGKSYDSYNDIDAVTPGDGGYY